VIALVARKQVVNMAAKDEQPQAKTPFYKKMWFWGIIVVLALIIIGAVSSCGKKSAASGTQPTKTEKVEHAQDNGKTTGNTIRIDNQKATILKQQTYHPNWANNSWAGTKVRIDRVTVLKVKPFKDHQENNNIYHGVVKVHYVVRPSRDISFRPTQGTLNTPKEKQLHANGYSSDDFDGALRKDATRSGNVLYTLKKLDHINDVNRLRLKWNASYDTDTTEDENAHYTYKITVNLK
jgi:hypothetical protein